MNQIVIVGAGFSGTMLAVHLAAAGVRVTLVDRPDRVAGGLAYATCAPEHVLNVRAGNMSAFPDAPDHFARWLEARGEGDAGTFAGRRVYRRYLAETLDAAPGIDIVDGEAVSVQADGVKLATGASLTADAVVIALGNLPPAPIAAFDQTADYANDPWHPDGRATIARLAAQDGDVLAVGTGLTMIDTVLSLDAQGFAGRIVATSRRGLLPRAHAAHAVPKLAPPVHRRPIALLRWVRRHAAHHDWRGVVDALRPITADIWRSWSAADKASFMRHLRPWWDVHRHRIAPHVAARMDGLIAHGRLVVRAGRIEAVDGQRVALRTRGETVAEPLQVAGVVNCTGPQGDIRRSAHGLIRDLLASGAARTDTFGLGLDIDEDCRVLGDVGVSLYAIGPMTRGAYWEIVAVPDIRVQAARLAGVIANDLAGTARGRQAVGT